MRPTWSPFLWTTIATGVFPQTHGVHDFTEVHIPGLDCGLQRLRTWPQLLPEHFELDLVAKVLIDYGILREEPITSCQRKHKAVWNVVSDAGGRAGVVNWMGSWPSEPLNGFVVSDQNPGRAAFLAYRLGADRKAFGITYPPDLLIELADVNLPNIPDTPEEILSLKLFEDLTTKERQELLELHGLLGVFRTIYLSDLFSMASARHILSTRTVDFLAVYVSGIDNISHRFLSYSGVVDRYYEFTDHLLGQLVKEAGDNTTFAVVSDHGFEYLEKNRIGHEHGPPGILILSGPSIRPASSLESIPSIVDIAPTILTLMGTPLSVELQGSPIKEALTPGFLENHPVRKVVSYGPYTAPSAYADEDDANLNRLQAERMKKLRTLGYIQ